MTLGPASLNMHTHSRSITGLISWHAVFVTFAQLWPECRWNLKWGELGPQFQRV